MEQGRSTSLRLGSQSNKLIPRDISESLGKIPPSAPELEEAVLGGVLLESMAGHNGKKPAIEEVAFLKPEHFYNENHSIIFNAVKQLQSAGNPIDMRTVVAQLRTTGHLEIIGGAYIIAELTAKVSSAANIEYHARVIVEMYLKRQFISLASKIHQVSYETDADIFKIWDDLEEDLKFLRERETASSGPERIKALWEKYRIITKPERPETLVKFNDADVCTVGNLSLLVGKKKSRKSLLVTYILSIFLRSRQHIAENIVIFDTEQEEYDVWVSMERLYRMTNQWVPIFCLRGLNPRERREFIEQTVRHWPSKLIISVIDGIRDCMSNINDPDESTEVMSWLMRLNVETKIHFINVLHLNKTDNNARGHIGSELLNKAEVTIEVEYNEKTGLSEVKCESSRRKPFDPFVFTHGATGLPELMGAPVGQDHVDQNEKVKRLQMVFEGEALSNMEVRKAICAQFGVGDNKARKLLAEFIRNGWVVKNGNDRAAGTVYKLNVSPGHVTPVEVHPIPQQMIDFTTPEHEPPGEDDLIFEL